MKKSNFTLTILLTLTALVIGNFYPVSAADNTNPPSSPVKLIFIHHSTGGHWLAAPNDYIYGELGKALMNNNYYVSATNYCWGPGQIGSRTDIADWTEWFVSSESSTILSALYNENGQNFENCEGDSFGSWQRLSADPGGENEIIMLKSCFPNSDLYGNPDDPPASELPEYWIPNVSNAKAVYNKILTYFQTRQDKLFVVITAPPMSEKGYQINDSSTPASVRAANARAFNNWLVNDWLDGYPHKNVAVFDYYNVLTSNRGNSDTNDAGKETGNHHRWWNGVIQHIQSVSNNFSSYPYFVGSDYTDDHPKTAGQQKATAEFVPLLNLFYHRWKDGGTVVSKPIVTTDSATSVTSDSATLNGTVNPNGSSTMYYFEYGTTTDYGSETSSISAGSGTDNISATTSVTGLTPNTTYYYRLVATNSAGTTNGNNMTFITQSSSDIIVGNIDGSADGKVDLKDAIMALKICAGFAVTGVILEADVNKDNKIGLEEAIYVLQMIAGMTPVTSGKLAQPSDFQYLGAFRLPGGDTKPKTFDYGGNAMTFNPDHNPSDSDGFPGSLFITGHDRQAYGELPDGDQVAEVSIPIPKKAENPEDLPYAEFIQEFQDVTKGYFKELEDIPKLGMQYLNHIETGPKIHLCWGRHLQQLEDNLASHAWFEPTLNAPNFKGVWFIGNQNPNSVNAYLMDIPTDWADTYIQGRCLGTGRVHEGGLGGMGPALIAYRPWQSSGTAPASGTHLQETALLLYENAFNTEKIEKCMNGYQHADLWEGGAWITTPSGKSAVLFAGNKSNGTKYWYGWRHQDGPEYPCPDTLFTDYITCRMADGSPCPAEDFKMCCEEGVDCISERGWWSTHFDAQMILYDPEDLAKVGSGTMESWEPQPYASIDIDDHLYLNPPVWDIQNLGAGDQRRYRISDVAYDRNNCILYILELYADGAKPVVHVWKIL